MGWPAHGGLGLRPCEQRGCLAPLPRPLPRHLAAQGQCRCQAPVRACTLLVAQGPGDKWHRKRSVRVVERGCKSKRGRAVLCQLGFSAFWPRALRVLVHRGPPGGSRSPRGLLTAPSGGRWPSALVLQDLRGGCLMMRLTGKARRGGAHSCVALPQPYRGSLVSQATPQAAVPCPCLACGQSGVQGGRRGSPLAALPPLRPLLSRLHPALQGRRPRGPGHRVTRQPPRDAAFLPRSYCPGAGIRGASPKSPEEIRLAEEDCGMLTGVSLNCAPQSPELACWGF